VFLRPEQGTVALTMRVSGGAKGAEAPPAVLVSSDTGISASGAVGKTGGRGRRSREQLRGGVEDVLGVGGGAAESGSESESDDGEHGDEDEDEYARPADGNRQRRMKMKMKKVRHEAVRRAELTCSALRRYPVVGSGHASLWWHHTHMMRCSPLDASVLLYVQ